MSVAAYLGLERTFFETAVDEGNSILRLLRYPQQDDPSVELLARPQVERALQRTPDQPEARRLAAEIAAHPEPSL